ncbi:MAG: hypothetical protein HOM85_01955, partial [Euryarchaeota archaeon]|nr:hypothetical protein [Euryarchaeota archaeon]
MRAIALVGLLVLSSFVSVVASQPQNEDGGTIGLRNGDVKATPISQVPAFP